MANVKISDLPAASTPLTGAELVPIVKSGVTSQTTVSDFGAAVSYTPSGTGAVTTTVQTKLRETVSVKDFGAMGDGVTDDTAAIQAAVDYCSSVKQGLFFPPGTYIVLAPKTRSFAGGTLYCSIDAKSDVNIFTNTKNSVVIKLANNVSTDAAPKNVVIFFNNTYIENSGFKNITFDLNGANNLISPNRGTGVYNRYLMASFCISSNNAWGNNISFIGCTFKNTSGTTCIAAGQSNLVGSTLSQNFFIDDCIFYNNGLDTDDHSCVYMWAENSRCQNSTFEQPTSLSKTNRNWVAYELHGSNQWFNNNTVKNFYRGCWIANNNTNTSNSLWVVDNKFEVWGLGPSLFNQSSTAQPISDVHIARNTISIDNTSTPLAIKAAIESNVYYSVSNIRVYNNIASFNMAGIGACAFIVMSGTTGTAKGDYFIYDNQSYGSQFGVYCRTYATGSVTWPYVEEKNNKWKDLQVTGTGISVGSYYISNATNPLQTIIVKNNTYHSTSTATGVRIEGGLSYLEIDNNTYLGMVESPSLSSLSISITNPNLVTRRLGTQLNTVAYSGFPTLSSSSTWKAGDRVYMYNGSRILNITFWEYTGSIWRAYGSGNGTTAERPTLTTDDAGYSYYDTTVNKMILWSGTAWLV